MAAEGFGGGEAAKAQRHLTLLRQEYVKLQQKHAELEQKYSIVASAAGHLGTDHYVTRLMHTIEELFDREHFSDITVNLDGRKLHAHRIVLAARGGVELWGDQPLAEITEFELKEVSYEVGYALMRWVYTDRLELPPRIDFVLQLLTAAAKYRLTSLLNKCENGLVSMVTVKNCVRLFQVANDTNAKDLRKYCLEMITNHWDELDTACFADMSAQLLYEMFKDKTHCPLHLAIQHQREDIVFLYLIEYDSELSAKLNERNEADSLPIELALRVRCHSIAETLVSHGCNLDMPNDKAGGECLLHSAIRRGDQYAADFLITRGASVNEVTTDTRESALHLTASYDSNAALARLSSPGQRGSTHSATTTYPAESMAEVAKLLLGNGANANMQDSQGSTPLHRAIMSRNKTVFDILLAHDRLDLELRDKERRTPLWLALESESNEGGGRMDVDSTATISARLVARGSSVEAVDPMSGTSLLHKAAAAGFETAALFLCRHGAMANSTERESRETPLHVASRNGLSQLCGQLLQSGSDPNARTVAIQRARTSIPQQPVAQSSVDEPSSLRHTAVGVSSTAPSAQHSAQHSAQASRAGSVDVGVPAAATMAVATVPSAHGAVSPQRFGLGATSGWSSDTDGMSAALSNLSDLTAAVSNTPGGNPFFSPVEENAPSGPGNPFGAETPSDGGNPFGVASPPKPAPSPGNPFGDDEEDDLSPHSRSGPASTDGSMSMAARHHQQQQQHQQQQPATATAAAAMPEPAAAPAPVVDLLHLEATAPSIGGLRTPLMMAIIGGHTAVVNVFLEFRPSTAQHTAVDLEIRDGDDESALGVALNCRAYNIAAVLLSAAARVDANTSSGLTLLHKAILRDDTGAASFLLEHGANIDTRTRDNRSPLQLAITRRLPSVVEVLCQRGADLNAVDENGTMPLWAALMSKQMDIATTLVKFGCDPNCWTVAPDGLQQTLLHRAIAMRNEEAAVFLVKSRADVDSSRRNPDGSNASGGSTPLHLCAASGLDHVVQCLVVENAMVNATDTDGRAPIHISISAKQNKVTALLLSHPNLDLGLKDRLGQTPFAAALAARDNDAANNILQRSPDSAHQTDSRGRNFLHHAVEKGDVEALVFLMSVGVDVRTPVQNASNQSALHLAVMSGSEIICRHLLLAGCTAADIDHHRRTPLHLAAGEDHASIAGVLLDNGADPNSIDDNYDNALHISVQSGHLSVSRKLLADSDVNCEVANLRGQTALHLLCNNPKDNAAALFDSMMEYRPQLNVNFPDAEGNTPILLAYMSGAGNLCRSLLRHNAHPGVINKQGVSMFNSPVATKKLLFRLLEMLSSEPPWLEGTQCYTCQANFGIKTRKHHCRHCGRLLCSKCTQQQMPIIKYDIHKPTRLCETCYDVLSMQHT
ncbi:rabankyrin-5-like [Sycon ciliatum]|uniref:rabankyrin-5-like n=1 Tax=Sycon ciliatum TaxID=27933 RepID=UPI0031F65080